MNWLSQEYKKENEEYLKLIQQGDLKRIKEIVRRDKKALEKVDIHKNNGLLISCKLNQIHVVEYLLL